ncbi:DUF3068 domain-containing protein [Nonomuraea soli]
MATAGIGSFLLVMAVLLPFAVYGRALAHPVDPALTVRMEGDRGTVFDTAELRERTGESLVQTIVLSGDRGAADSEVAVWTEFATLNRSGGERVDYRQRRLGFDRRTGFAVDCCAAYPAKASGLAFRWPFDASRRDYPLTDPVTGQSFPARFQAVESLHGLTVHRYAQTVPRTFTGEGIALPYSVLSVQGRGQVTLERHVAITRSVWVEPVSGIPVKVTEQRVDTLVAPGGQEARTLLRAELTTSAADTAALAASARRVVLYSALMRTVLPLVFGGLGLVMTATGLWSGWRVSSAPPPARQEQAQDESAPGPRAAEAGAPPGDS